VGVHLKVAGFVDGRMVTAEADIEVPEGTSLKKMFKLADKSGKLPKKLMKKIMSQPRQPTVLLNGETVDLPAGLKTTVSGGDEVAVMMPLAGG